MADKPKVSANQGTPEALPKGMATDINNAPSGTPPEDPQAVQPQAQPAVPADYQPKFVPQTEDDNFITGPTTRPDESLIAGGRGNVHLAPEVQAALPAFVEAAQAPDADPRLQALVSLLQFHSGR